MNKRISSRAIIIENNKLLTFFRRKNKDGKIKEYYSLPGGGQEKGETLEENVIRELKEEFNVDIKIIDYLGKKESDNYIEHFFYCTIINGILIYLYTFKKLLLFSLLFSISFIKFTAFILLFLESFIAILNISLSYSILIL